MNTKEINTSFIKEMQEAATDYSKKADEIVVKYKEKYSELIKLVLSLNFAQNTDNEDSFVNGYDTFVSIFSFQLIKYLCKNKDKIQANQDASKIFEAVSKELIEKKKENINNVYETFCKLYKQDNTIADMSTDDIIKKIIEDLRSTN